jgi:hypothetical protein
MGTDISARIEHRLPPWRGADAWGVWAEGDFGIERSYLLFSALAGVRAEDGYPEAVAEPRGLPGRPTWGGPCDALRDHYACSWLSLAEVEEAHRRVLAWLVGHDGGKMPNGDDVRSGLEGVLAAMRHLEEDGLGARFVFGFNS